MYASRWRCWCIRHALKVPQSLATAPRGTLTQSQTAAAAVAALSDAHNWSAEKT